MPPISTIYMDHKDCGIGCCCKNHQEDFFSSPVSGMSHHNRPSPRCIQIPLPITEARNGRLCFPSRKQWINLISAAGVLHLVTSAPTIVAFSAGVNIATHISNTCQTSQTTRIRNYSTPRVASTNVPISEVDFAALDLDEHDLPLSSNVLMRSHPSSSSSLSSSSSSSFYDWELRLMHALDQRYTYVLRSKCPFWRRRMSDLLDGMDMILRHVIIQHKSLMPPPPAWRCDGDTCVKRLGISLEELLEVVRHDWRTETNRGYYITGRLSTFVYRDDCIFDGPDPDMPVQGLRKYLNAASQLFEQSKSHSELLSLEIQGGVIVAQWRMNGILRLPWRPRLPEVKGTTTYFTDYNGLIYRHVETWDISVMEAFLKTLLPSLADHVWNYHHDYHHSKHE